MFEGSVAATAKKPQLDRTKTNRTEKGATDYNRLQPVFDYIIKSAKIPKTAKKKKKKTMILQIFTCIFEFFLRCVALFDHVL